MPDHRTDAPTRLPPRPAASSEAVVVKSSALLKGTRELRIVHGDQTYRLCHTRNDKLILIK